VAERDVGDHVLVAGEPDDEPRRAVAGGVAGEVETPQLAAGLDAEGVGHAHAAAAGGAVGQPDRLLRQPAPPGGAVLSGDN